MTKHSRELRIGIASDAGVAIRREVLRIKRPQRTHRQRVPARQGRRRTVVDETLELLDAARMADDAVCRAVDDVLAARDDGWIGGRVEVGFRHVPGPVPVHGDIDTQPGGQDYDHYRHPLQRAQDSTHLPSGVTAKPGDIIDEFRILIWMALGIKFCFENELAAPRSSRVHRSLLILGGCTKQDPYGKPRWCAG